MKSHDTRPGSYKLPKHRILQALLRKTTERLAHELCCPTPTAPDWSALEWRIAEATAVMHGISALLANRLRWKGPDRWQTFLASQRWHTSLRHARIEELLQSMQSHAQRSGLAVMAMKGAALYRFGLYMAGDRPMSDIDLLVRPSDVDQAVRMITALGYHAGPATPRHGIFLPDESTEQRGFGEHIGNPIKIELHVRVMERLPVSEVDITALTLPQQAGPGLHFYPSPAALMRHLLLHTAANLRARAMRFLQLHDIAALASRMRKEDWRELAEADPSAPVWWALAPLELTTRYFPHAVPRELLGEVRAACHWPLRLAARHHSITDVSWSKLRIQAFPGIEWCHTAPEALRFMASRAFPDRTMRHTLHDIADKQAYSAGTPWYGLSHRARVLRWLFSSPPRVQAIYPIRVALGLQAP